ncbi:hypothetical protein LguiB_013311 [Lonicera macranthoides]
MRRSSFVTGHVFALLILLLLFLDASYTCTAETEQCAPSSCGNISNINYPFFQLKGDRRTCNNSEHIIELACEEDNRTTLSLPPGNNKYYVQNISYDSPYVRLQLVDAGLDAENYCYIPAGHFPFHLTDSLTELFPFDSSSCYFISCPTPIPFSKTTINYSSCITNISSASQTNDHFYAIVGDYNYSSPPDIPDSCTLSNIYPITSDLDYNNLSISYIHQKLLLGFEVEFHFYDYTPMRWYILLYVFLQGIGHELERCWDVLKRGDWKGLFTRINKINDLNTLSHHRTPDYFMGARVRSLEACRWSGSGLSSVVNCMEQGKVDGD